MTYTPWGRSDSQHTYGRGIVFYSTPGHGGFHLSPDRLVEMDAALRPLAETFGRPGWFEEDCAALAVVATWPEVFVGEHLDPEGGSRLKTAETIRAEAIEGLRRWCPAEAEAAFGAAMSAEGAP